MARVRHCAVCGNGFTSREQVQRFCTRDCWKKSFYVVPAIERFVMKVDQDGPVHPTLGTACWVWKAGANGDGYGHFNVDGRDVGAHRFALSIAYGDAAKGKIAAHHCDNPKCVRPSHLFPATTKENAEDCVRKGRSLPGAKNPSRRPDVWEKLPRGEASARAKLTEKAVREIIASKEQGKVLAERYGMGQSQISRIRRRQAWEHLDSPSHAPRPLDS